MAQDRSAGARYEWETIHCPVPGCDEEGPRIHIRSHLTDGTDPAHEHYAETESL